MSPDKNSPTNRPDQPPQPGAEPDPDALPTSDQLAQEALDYYEQGGVGKRKSEPKPSILDGEVELPPELEP